MKDRNGNNVSVGAKLRSIKGGAGPNIECIEITSDKSLGTFKWLTINQRNFKLNAKNLSSSNWVITE